CGMRANEQNTQVFRSTHTFVGLICWLAAKYTRSPFRARFARSASRPIVSRSLDSKRASASSRVRRSLRETLSAILSSDGSRAVMDGQMRNAECGMRNRNADSKLDGPHRSEFGHSAFRTPNSAFESRRPPHGQRGVVATEPERVGQGD